MRSLDPASDNPGRSRFRQLDDVFRYWQDLAPSQREQLCRQAEDVDPELLQRLFHQAESPEGCYLPAAEAIRPAAVAPLADSERSRSEEARAARRGRRAARP